jgi:hypothetical protein
MATLNLPGGWAVSVNRSNKSSGGRKTTTVSMSFTGKAGSAGSKGGSAKKK